MKYIKRGFSLLLLVAITFFGSGCTKLFGPSDEEVIKAINDSGVLNRFTVAAPIVVLEKGKQAKDGSYPVKIRLTLTLKTKDGRTTTRVTNPIFNIHKTKDSAGKTVWTVGAGA